ncbi:MAG: GNAT family N-acetyltransferase [Candidatus Lokiarchaeota archaeon]|nr:GNAT family N-acetyltransferase [Candidatus Lokiarchaeota archaeon]
MKILNGYSKVINDSMILRVANDEIGNFQRFISFNLVIHQVESLRRYVNRLYMEHPRKSKIYWIYIEKIDTNELVSMITLMPLEWNFNGVNIPLCEMGLVGTLPEYRHRGLIGIMNEIYEILMRQEGYLLSVIRGIPYYYRKFGYEFALNLDEHIILNKDLIPSKEINNIYFQKATKQDLSFIKSIYNKEQENFYISNGFNPDCFIYKCMNDDFDNNFLNTFILKRNKESISYFSLGMSFDYAAYSLIVPELDDDYIIKILQFVRDLDKDKDQIVFNVNSETQFGQFLSSIGGEKDLGYGWQIKILDLKEFLLAIKPILEQRIESSSFKGLSQDFVISDYRYSYFLRFKSGKIEGIESKQGYPLPESCDVKIPSSNLIKLLLSDKTFNEIKHIVKDSMLKPMSEELLEILFPKKPSIPDTYY